jgi:hypothetical protein
LGLKHYAFQVTQKAYTNTYMCIVAVHTYELEWRHLVKFVKLCDQAVHIGPYTCSCFPSLCLMTTGMVGWLCAELQAKEGNEFGVWWQVRRGTDGPAADRNECILYGLNAGRLTGR